MFEKSNFYVETCHGMSLLYNNYNGSTITTMACLYNLKNHWIPAFVGMTLKAEKGLKITNK